MTKEYLHKTKLTIIVLIVGLILAEVSANILSIVFNMSNIFMFASSIIIFIVISLVGFSVIRKQFFVFNKKLTSLLHNLKIKELIIELKDVSDSSTLYKIYVLKYHLFFLDHKARRWF